MKTSKYILDFLLNLELPALSLKEVVTLHPYTRPETIDIVNRFYQRFYNDQQLRIAFIGINPGRLGSGLTGIGFTDPVNLEEIVGISNSFDKKHELSSRFIYDMIEAFGGLEAFYQHIYITSVVPLGFTKDEVNLNYYDIPQLQTELVPYVKKQFEAQLPFLRRDVAFCIGKGKNYHFLQKLNQSEGYFERIEVLPHPRWVMQYRLKRKDEFIAEYIETIGKYCNE